MESIAAHILLELLTRRYLIQKGGCGKSCWEGLARLPGRVRYAAPIRNDTDCFHRENDGKCARTEGATLRQESLYDWRCCLGEQHSCFDTLLWHRELNARTVTDGPGD